MGHRYISQNVTEEQNITCQTEKAPVVVSATMTIHSSKSKHIHHVFGMICICLQIDFTMHETANHRQMIINAHSFAHRGPASITRYTPCVSGVKCVEEEKKEEEKIQNGISVRKTKTPSASLRCQTTYFSCRHPQVQKPDNLLSESSGTTLALVAEIIAKRLRPCRIKTPEARSRNRRKEQSGLAH